MSESLAPMTTRADLDDDVVMIFDGYGNAYTAFEYTPESLEAHARELRRSLGEATTVTYGPSPFMSLPSISSSH